MPWYEKWGHQILDVIGAIPFIGDLANAPNAAWYALQGDWADAGMTSAGMIPFLGDVALGAKLTKDGKNALEGLKLLRAGELTGDVVTDTRRSLALLKAGEEIEPGVIKFTSEADFRAAANVPHPNVTYEYKGIRYTTDEHARTISVSGTPLKSRGFADRSLRRVIGKTGVDGDIGFHLFAESFGGDTTALNVVAGNGSVAKQSFKQFKNLNGGDYAKMENQVRAAIKDPAVNDVNLKVQPHYPDGSPRPDSFDVTVRINGIDHEYYFENAPTRRR